MESESKDSFRKEYESLILQKLRLEVEHKKIPTKKSVRWANFWQYIFPALISFITVGGSFLILYFSNFFEINERLSEAKNVELKNQTDSLNSRKLKVVHDFDSVNFELAKSKWTLEANLNELNEIAYIKDSVQNNYVVLNSKYKSITEETYRYRISQINDYLDNYEENIFKDDSPEIDSLYNITKRDGRYYRYFKQIVDRDIQYDDSLPDLVNAIKLARLGQLCIDQKKYRTEFIVLLKKYTA
jgi:hypothetical protein